MIFISNVYFEGFIERLQDEIPSFERKVVFSPHKVLRQDISTPSGENDDLSKSFIQIFYNINAIIISSIYNTLEIL